MMTNQSIKNLAAWMSHPLRFKFVNNAPNDIEKKRRIEQLKNEFMQSNFASVNFSNLGYVENSTGVPSLDDDFAAERALTEIKRLIIRADLEKTLVPQIQAKNAITKRNAQRRLEFQESLQKNY